MRESKSIHVLHRQAPVEIDNGYQWIVYALMVGFLLASLTACSTIVPKGRRLASPKTPKRIEAPIPSPVVREPGSLWSDRSEWNDVYSAPPTRAVGDILMVKLTPRFKNQALRRLELEYPPSINEKKSAKTIKKKAVAEAAAKPADKKGKKDEPVEPAVPESESIYATIMEVLPRKVYRVAASETLRIGDRNPVVTFEGEVRDRDVGQDDAVSADNVMHLGLEIQPDGGQRKVSSEYLSGDAS